MQRLLSAALAMAALLAFRPAAGQELPVDLELVLAVDVSGSVSIKDAAVMRVTSAVGDARSVLVRVGGGQVQLGKTGTYLGTFVAPTGQLELGDTSTLADPAVVDDLTVVIDGDFCSLLIELSYSLRLRFVFLCIITFRSFHGCAILANALGGLHDLSMPLLVLV